MPVAGLLVWDVPVTALHLDETTHVVAIDIPFTSLRDGDRHLELGAALVALADAQGGLERVRNTPLPVRYRFLPRFFSRLFCLILPFAVVEDLGRLTPVGPGLVGLMFLMAVQVGDQLGNPF
ncbi:MAG: bestrophin family ion channel, partial [Janthinobacterium lividum]